MASAGFGTNPQLSMELFAIMAQIRLIHVPYKSSTPGIIDLIAGHVAIMAPNDARNPFRTCAPAGCARSA